MAYRRFLWSSIYLACVAFSVTVQAVVLGLHNTSSVSICGSVTVVCVGQTGVTGSLPNVTTAINCGTPLAAGGYYTVNSVGLSVDKSATYDVFWTPSGGSEQYLGRYMIGFGYSAYAPVSGVACIFPATVSNNSSAGMVGYWKNNGEQVFATYLAPGQSYTYTYTYDCSGSALFDYGMAHPDPVIDLGTNGMLNVDLGLTGVAETSPNINSTNAPIGHNGSSDLGGGGYTNGFSSFLTNSGIINWNNPDTTVARDATLRAGFAQSANDSSRRDTILADIDNQLKTSFPLLLSSLGGGGSTNSSGLASNVWVQNFPAYPTNADGSSTNGPWTNGLTLDQLGNWYTTNADALTNHLITRLGNTHMADGQLYVDNQIVPAFELSEGVKGQLEDASSFAIPDVPDVNPDSDLTLPISSSHTMHISLASVDTSAFVTVRSYGAWVVWLLTWLAMWNHAQKWIPMALNQKQLRGSSESSGGFNASMELGLVYATVLVSVIFTMLGVLADHLITPVSDAGSFTSSANAIFSGPIAHLILGWFPLNTIFTALTTYVTFYFVGFWAYIACVTVILMLIV